MKRGRLVLVKQDDETTLFECPDCGQRGSVPTPVLQNALSETDDVRISCTNCPTKFSPLATYTAMAEEASDNGKSENGESDNGESDDAIIDALKANWQAADAAISKNNETAAAQDENDNAGALPAWLRPPEKKSEPTKSATTEPQEDISANDEADDEADDEASNISTNDDQDAGDDISDVLTDDNEPVAIAEAEDEPLEISDSAPPQMPAPQTASYQTDVEAGLEVEPKIQPEAPSPAFVQAPEETPQTSQDALTQWDDVDEEELEEYSQDGDVYRQPVDLLNAVQLILLTIVALLFAFSGFILLTSI